MRTIVDPSTGEMMNEVAYQSVPELRNTQSALFAKLRNMADDPKIGMSQEEFEILYQEIKVCYDRLISEAKGEKREKNVDR